MFYDAIGPASPNFVSKIPINPLKPVTTVPTSASLSPSASGYVLESGEPMV
ncbi:hypothetical protein [Neobacillus niacini]|uniref:hypothetical protein n=1 Tax=Neobacillus niacini TaxID=86668 RepID=UPI00285D3E39|nr:hypothetical protein [Neobacillus niacini]MDR6999654.1 hypothetical protein [Neobacillus niacini]